MSDKDKELTTRVAGTLRDKVLEVHAEVQARDDVFEDLTPHIVMRRLIAHALKEHMAGRGPWPKR